MTRMKPAVLLVSLCLFLIPATRSALAGKTQPITMSLPAAALHQTISALLPLPITLQGQGKQFEGKISIDSISKLTIGDNLIGLQGQVSGTDMKVTTNIGGQNIQLKVGKLVLPVTCDIALRFDREKKILYCKPQFHNPLNGKNNSAQTLLPLLNSLSDRWYKVPLEKLTPLHGKVGTQTVSVQMEVIDVQAGKDRLVFKFLPIAGKK